MRLPLRSLLRSPSLSQKAQRTALCPSLLLKQRPSLRLLLMKKLRLIRMMKKEKMRKRNRMNQIIITMRTRISTWTRMEVMMRTWKLKMMSKCLSNLNNVRVVPLPLVFHF